MTEDRYPRTTADAIAAGLGVSAAYVRQDLAKRLRLDPEWASHEAEQDARMEALDQLATVDALTRLNDLDVADAASEPNPEEALDEIVAERAERTYRTSMTAAERSMRAQLAAHTRWANADRAESTERAREAFMARFEREVDPDGILEPGERVRRAEHARKAYMLRLSMKSAKVRRERAEQAK